jgi:hypothetical protein
MSIEAVRIARDVPFKRNRPRAVSLLWVGGLLVATAALMGVLAGGALVLLLVSMSH